MTKIIEMHGQIPRISRLPSSDESYGNSSTNLYLHASCRRKTCNLP